MSPKCKQQPVFKLFNKKKLNNNIWKIEVGLIELDLGPPRKKKSFVGSVNKFSSCEKSRQTSNYTKIYHKTFDNYYLKYH